MNFVSRSRKSGMAGQLYSFLHNLSEEARGRDNMVSGRLDSGVGTGDERRRPVGLRAFQEAARPRG